MNEEGAYLIQEKLSITSNSAVERVYGSTQLVFMTKFFEKLIQRILRYSLKEY